MSLSRSCRAAFAVLAFAGLALAACEDETTTPTPVFCPNAIPSNGDGCPEAGLVCHYFTGCKAARPATCGDDLRWDFEPCTPTTGAGGAGGSSAASGGSAPASNTSAPASASSSSAASSGAGGGSGGSGGAGGN